MAVAQTGHGTLTGYTREKCRCEECRACWRGYMTKARTKRGEELPPGSAALFTWLLTNDAIRHAETCATNARLTTRTRCDCGLAAAWDAHIREVGQ